MIVGPTGNRNAAGLDKLLQPRRDVDAIAMSVVALDNDVAQVDSHANIDVAVRRDRPVPLGHAALQDDGALDGIDDAGKLGQQAIAHQLEDVAVVLLDLWLKQLLAMGT